MDIEVPPVLLKKSEMNDELRKAIGELPPCGWLLQTHGAFPVVMAARPVPGGRFLVFGDPAAGAWETHFRRHGDMEDMEPGIPATSAAEAVARAAEFC